MWSNSSSVQSCVESSEALVLSFTSSSAKFILVLPPSTFVLLRIFQRWRSQKPLSHSDFFTLHMALVQIVNLCSLSIYVCGLIISSTWMTVAGYYCSSITFPLETLIHGFTCVDRYLAAAHPVTYLNLGKAKGVGLRKAAMGCAWLLGLGYLGLIHHYFPSFPYTVIICFLGADLAVILFCSVSVLRVLIRPGPSDVERVDQSKRRAFNVISAIMAALLFWLTGILSCMSLQYSPLLSKSVKCRVFVSVLWVNIPSNLVLLVLFLKREQKIPCCK